LILISYNFLHLHFITASLNNHGQLNDDDLRITVKFLLLSSFKKF